MNIKYILSLPTSLVYHIFSQIDLKNEWSDASIFSQEYTGFLNEHGGENLLLEDTQKEKIKNELKDYFILITFACLRPWYEDYDKLLNDFKNNDFIAKKISTNSNLELDKAVSAFLYLTSLMNNLKNDYLDFWQKNKKLFEEKIEIFENKQKEIFIQYYKYLYQKFLPNYPQKDNFFIFMIPSLFYFGRGLEGGCAVGIAFNNLLLKHTINLSMHELTHSFTDQILITKFETKSKNNPNDQKDHQIKEQAAEYVLQNFLKQKNPSLFKKRGYPLLTEKIKKLLEY